MKYIKIAGLALLTVLWGASCKKQLVQDPSNAIPTGNAFQTVNDFELADQGMYYQMVHAENYIGGADAPISWISTMDLLADNLISQSTGRGSQRTFGNWQYNKSNTTGMFEDGYRIIRSANAILENIANIDGAAQKDNYEGEALAVRAMVHFDLLRIYSKPVSGPQADLNGLGVPYVKTTDVKDKPARGTVKETYDNVVADLIKAATLINVDNGVGRLNKAAVYGLLSRVYLYGGEWQKCIDASTECLNSGVDVASITDFPSIWTDQSESGVLFKIRFTQQDEGTDGTIAVGVGYSQTGPTGVKSEWVCSYSLAQMFDTNDVRTDAYILPTTYNGIDYNAINKYMGRPNEPLGLVDVKYLRVAEVLLNRAEAEANTGDDPAALDDLNHLRENRYFNYTAGTETGQALKDAIQHERRLELAFEGDRWFTLKRLGLPVERDNFGDQADGTGTPYFVKELPAGDIHWEIPLLQTDIQANPNLKQNPGYGN
ncbi:MAG TPA: RagB/SusD family nutrient uptake outer membrane protein [Edaphocola sp.]|nr:RagB/SusD family nutrient uptake outer membrane protein [Edaphocola sp.]